MSCGYVLTPAPKFQGTGRVPTLTASTIPGPVIGVGVPLLPVGRVVNR